MMLTQQELSAHLRMRLIPLQSGAEEVHMKVVPHGMHGSFCWQMYRWKARIPTFWGPDFWAHDKR